MAEDAATAALLQRLRVATKRLSVVTAVLIVTLLAMLVMCVMALEDVVPNRKFSFQSTLYALCGIAASLAFVDGILIGTSLVIVLRLHLIRTGSSSAWQPALVCRRLQGWLTALLRRDSSRGVSPVPLVVDV